MITDALEKYYKRLVIFRKDRERIAKDMIRTATKAQNR